MIHSSLYLILALDAGPQLILCSKQAILAAATLKRSLSLKAYFFIRQTSQSLPRGSTQSLQALNHPLASVLDRKIQIWRPVFTDY